jgi:hypothetical protein
MNSAVVPHQAKCRATPTITMTDKIKAEIPPAMQRFKRTRVGLRLMGSASVVQRTTDVRSISSLTPLPLSWV